MKLFHYFTVFPVSFPDDKNRVGIYEEKAETGASIKTRGFSIVINSEVPRLLPSHPFFTIAEFLARLIVMTPDLPD
jgi:hypothetical protein